MHKINKASHPILFTGSKVKVLMSGKDTMGQFCMLEFIGPSGRSTPLHSHDREEETIHMLSGQLEVTMGDETVTLRAGDTILLPRHVAHRLSTQGDEDAHYLVLCTPAGFDEFVLACASDDSASTETSLPTPVDIARLREEAPRFGITLFPGP